MKKDTSHCTFRNGNLFCAHCGIEQLFPLPMGIKTAAGMMLGFVEDHRNCTIPQDFLDKHLEIIDVLNDSAKKKLKTLISKKKNQQQQ